MIVAGRGNKNAKIAFIGEAPGGEEIRTGEPFRGPSGRLLDTILGHNGIAESEIYVDNVCQSPPSGRNPNYSELLQAIPGLRSRLRDLPNVNCICAVGNIALQALSLFRYSGIQKYRGSILPARLINKKMVPILHPAFILKDGNAEYRMLHVSIGDVARAKEEANTAGISLPVRNHRIIYNFDEAIQNLRLLANTPYWAFDVETSLPCLGFATDSYNSFTIPFASVRYPHIWPEKERLFLIEEVRQAFANKEAKIITQNGFFDKRVLWKDYGIDPLSWRIWIDTMHLHQLLYSELPHSLAFLCSVYTREPFYKDEGATFRRGIDDEAGYFRYNGKDCCVTFEAAFEMLEELREIPGQEDYYFQILESAIQNLFRMHMNGVFIHGDNLGESIRLLKRVETIERIKIIKSSGMDPNPRAPTEMEPFLLGLGIKEKDLTRTPKTNQIQLKSDTFERLFAKYQHPALAAILRLRKNLFIQSGFTNISQDPDGRYRIIFKLGPKSGRLSTSAEDRGPQLQNIPGVPSKEKLKTEPNLRSVYAAPPGRVLLAADLEQADTRALAYYAPEPNFIAMFEGSDPDIHAQVCSQIFSIPRKEITKHGEHASKRKISKILGHGTNYGMGPRRVVNTLRDEGIFIAEREAKEFQSAYLARFFGIPVFHSNIQKSIRQSRCVYDLLGRRHMFLGFIDDKCFQEAYSRPPQATVAGVMLKGMNQLQDAFDTYEWKNTPLILMQIHDELIAECDEADALIVAQLMNENMSIPLTAHERNFVIPMEINVGRNWGEMCPLLEWAGLQSISFTQKITKRRTSFTSGAPLQYSLMS